MEPVDEAFECDAPRFYDFTKEPQTPSSPSVAEAWFGRLDETPEGMRTNVAEPLLRFDDDGDIVEGSSFTQFDDSDDDNANNDVNDNNVDNDLTPRPSKSSSRGSFVTTTTAAPETAEDNEDFHSSVNVNEEEMLASKMANLRMKPFTPTKSSKLTTHVLNASSWADDVWQDDHDDDDLQNADTHAKHADKKKPANFVPTRSVKPLTIPKPFNFATNSRIAKPTTTENNKSIVLSSSATTAKKATVAGVTKPKPFKFHTSLKSATDSAATKSPYVPLAERIKMVEKTPDRFKRAPAKVPIVKKKTVLMPTRPKSPPLMTKLRTKSQHVLSTEERILKEMKTHQTFKARPVNPKILASAGDLGVPRIKKSALTVPHSPAIQKPHWVAPTDPSPPRVIKAQPFKPPKPFQPKVEHRLIQPTNFKLPGEELSERRKQALEQERRAKIEEERRLKEFHARGLPDLDRPDPLPSVPKQELTDPHTPNLATKKRGQVYRQVLEEKRMMELEEEQNRIKFHARPVPDLDHPFVPKKTDVHVTENEPVVLYTDLRAQERKVFEETMKEKERLMEMAKEQQMRDEKEREQEEIKKLRQQQTFHANPIKTVPKFEPKKSNKPLTEPESPMFVHKRKAMAQHHV